MSIKVTSWNIEHLHDLLLRPDTQRHRRRLNRIAEQIRQIEPDVLAIVEGPAGEAAIQRFADDYLGGFLAPVTLEAGGSLTAQREVYRTKGSQWVWFLVRPWLSPSVELVRPEAYQQATGRQTWDVHYWGEMTEQDHSHYRHPQVLALAVSGVRIEFIGLHLKSKLNRTSPMWTTNGTLRKSYVRKALQNRIKTATEATDVRDYINRRIDEDEDAGIVVVGDMNDGPGKDHFEQLYLFFDLVGNLQGDIISPERFLNHALFDYADALRWTARFRDPVTRTPASRNPLLLDHVLFSQGLVNGRLPLRVNPHAGSVEHAVHEFVNRNEPSSTMSSDHRPVSCYFND